MVLTKQEKKWRAESDAYTLVEAETIKLDKARRTQALKEVKRLAKEAEDKAKATKNIAKRVSPKKKRTGKKKK